MYVFKQLINSMAQKEIELKLDWLAELVEKIPTEPPEQRKNFFDIAGFPRWENVNSNLLAFYFDKNEEHKFGSLFIKSILDKYYTKSTNAKIENLYDGNFSVKRESPPNNSRKRIDLLLEYETGWTIIIENKIDASLYNDLEDYWNRVEAKNKIGIVLSVLPIEIPERNEKFVNITHLELVEQVKQNLSDYYLNADDRHLMFLKEYILNIEAMYPNKNHEEMDAFLKEYQKNRENIEELKNLKFGKYENNLDNITKFQSFIKQLYAHVAQPVYEIMNKYGFSSGASKLDNSARFRIDQNFKEKHDYGVDYDTINRLLFWVDFRHLRYHSEFSAYYELYDKENTKYGNRLEQRLLSENVYCGCVSIREDRKEGGGHFHIYKILIPINFETSKSFKEALIQALDEHFFVKGFIEKAVKTLDEIIEEEKTKK